MRQQAATLLWRAGIAAALVCAIGLLPWLNRTDPALAENQPYAERAPWAVLAPAAVLALLGALAVTAAGGVRTPRRTPRPPVTEPEQQPRTRELVEAR
ncbi:hypothetical protein [Streptomyces sp. WM6386]|uniref:hypothetical protein n=1 Tax=Streptomyces sp. WM6386 TaxID=1415558 RepID=UPI0006196B3C|nr:hypothetical protein TN53_00225 [Streptomyces sp. WM6386]